MENLRLGLVQIQSSVGQTELNLKKIKDFVDSAAAQDVHIICFPELALQGYSRAKSYLYAEPIPGPSSQQIINLAKQTGVTIVLGMAETSHDPDKPYVTQLVALPDGTWHRYRKTHLGRSEAPYFLAGEEFPVFAAPKANFGVQICWDLHFPEISAIMSLKGAEIIFAPHASPEVVGDRIDIWMRYLSGRAYDNTVFVAACNLVGPNNDSQVFCGGALVLDPKGNVVAQSFSGCEEMLVADLDCELINRVRNQESKSMRNSFFLDARRPELYRELIELRKQQKGESR